MPVAEVHGPGAALALVESLQLDRYHLFHAIRADLLRRLDRDTEAGRAYEAAITRTDNAIERRFLERRTHRGTGRRPLLTPRPATTCSALKRKRGRKHLCRTSRLLATSATGDIDGAVLAPGAALHAARKGKIRGAPRHTGRAVGAGLDRVSALPACDLDQRARRSL